MKSAIQSVLLSVLCFSVAAMAACGESTSGENNSGSIGDVDTTTQITLKIESAAPLKQNYSALLRSETEGTQLYNQALFTKNLVQGFKEIYPNIKLQFIEDGWGEALYQQQQLYIRDYSAGGAMAVDVMIGETYMGYFAKNGVFAELNSSKFSDVLEGAYADVMFDGKMYGTPMCTGIMGLQYNTQILQEAGVPESEWVPGTWAELKENCRIVNEYAKSHKKNYGGIVMNAVSGMSSAFRAVPFLRQAGGDITDADGNLTLNSAANVEAFSYLRELSAYAYGESLTCDNEDTLQYYFTNKGYGAYMLEGQWSMAGSADYIKSAPLPKKSENGTGVGNVFMGNVLFGITKGSNNKAAAQAFLQYLTSAEVQAWLYELDGRLPINKTTLASDEIRTVHANINSYIDTLIAGGFKGGVACFTKNANDIWARWGTFYKNVLNSTTEITALANAAQTDILAKM